MVKIFRIEDKNGDGMYRCNGAGFYSIASQDDNRHPSPYEDSKLRRQIAESEFVMHIHHFGFGSEEQLRNWIYRDEWLVKLEEQGFVLAIIEAEVAYVGSTQAVFIRPEVYEKVSITEYFKLTKEH